MAIVTGQATIDNTIPTVLCTIPAGVVGVLLCNIGPATAMVGPAGGPLLNTGYFIGPSCVPTYFATSTSSKATTLATCVNQNGQTATVSFLLST